MKRFKKILLAAILIMRSPVTIGQENKSRVMNMQNDFELVTKISTQRKLSEMNAVYEPLKELPILR